MTMLAVWWCGAAQAASLDLLEVGGAFGTPAATNPTALWWNPAGLAVHGGTQVYAEGAPTFGSVAVDRPNPDYGPVTLTPEMEAAGFPGAYAYGGTETFRSTAVVPFLGASSDFGVPGLGVGLGVMVPSGRGASSTERNGPNRYAIREGMILAPRVSLGAAWRWRELVSVGLSGAAVRSSFYADSDVSTYPDLTEAVRDYIPGGVLPPEFQDAWIEDPAYGANLVLGGAEKGGGHGSLTDTAFTFGGGLYLTPLGEKLGISLAWNQGVSLANTGDLTLRFACPPAFDATARATAEDGGLCDSTIPGRATVSYRLPSRLHLGVAVVPTDRVRVELMGAWVGWGVFDDYDVSLEVDKDDLDGVNPDATARSATLLSAPRQQARGARDTFWVGVDGKVDLSELVLVGARATFDRSAIPTAYVSGNNLDADTLLLQGVTQLRPSPKVGIGLSYTYALSGAREVTDSVFSQDLARANVTHPRYYLTNPAVNRTFYPTANGTYALDVHRLGISVQGRFGGAGRL
jgi:long-chain fatty acid transport protein